MSGLRHIIWLFAIVFSSGAYAITDEAFGDALDAARKGQFSAVPESAADHVLAGYLEFHRLRTDLPAVTPEAIEEYARKYNDSPLGHWLKRQALTSYEKNRRWSDILALFPQVPSDATGRCVWYRAQLVADQELAFRGGRQLWLSGQSRPEECDDLFKAMSLRGHLDADLYYQRLLLSLEAGNRNLSRYLLRKLDKAEWSDVVAYVREVLRHPEHLRQVPAPVRRQVNSDELAVSVLTYLVPRNTRLVIDLWTDMEADLNVPDGSRLALEHSIAANSFRLKPEERDDAVVARLKASGSSEWMGPPMRDAIASGDWPVVLDWIAAIPEDEQTSSYYRYWQGRALEATGEQDAAEFAYSEAAQSRNFYGFLAAERTGQAYTLNMTAPEVTDDGLKALADIPAIKRIAALWTIGEHGLALEELNYLVSLRPAITAELAEFSVRNGWHSLAVQTTIKGGHWNFIQHRFPAAFQDEFGHWAETLNLDSSLLMAIARRESSFNPFAQSGVGARGLMQLMPGTARQVAREIKAEYRNQDDLFEHDTNIRLGSHYVRSLLDRFDGNLIAALASYNAGPHRVDRWLNEPVQSYDQFIESIPFRETREYVKAVLAYRVIFNSLNGQEISAVLAPAERGFAQYVSSTDLASAEGEVTN